MCISKKTVEFPVHTLPDHVQDFIRESVILAEMRSAVRAQSSKVDELRKGVRKVCEQLPGRCITYQTPVDEMSRDVFGPCGRIRVCDKSRRGTLTRDLIRSAVVECLQESKEADAECITARVWDNRPHHHTSRVEWCQTYNRKRNRPPPTAVVVVPHAASKTRRTLEEVSGPTEEGMVYSDKSESSNIG